MILQAEDLSLKSNQQLESAGVFKMSGSYLKADSWRNHVNNQCIWPGPFPRQQVNSNCPVFMRWKGLSGNLFLKS